MDIKIAREILEAKIAQTKNETEVFTFALSMLQNQFIPELTTIAKLEQENIQIKNDLAEKDRVINEKDAIINLNK